MRFLLLLLVCGISALAHAEEIQGVSEFIAEITAAYQSKDIKAIQQHFYDAGVPKDVMEKAVASWSQSLSENSPEAGWKFSDVTFIPLEMLQQPPPSEQSMRGMSDIAKEGTLRGYKNAQEIVEQLTKPFLQDGSQYQYNLKVIGLLSINFKNGADRQTGFGKPVGRDPGGSLRFTLLQPTKD